MAALDREELIEFVRRTPLFSGLGADPFDAIASGIRFTRQDRGTPLFNQDEPALLFYLVIDGWVKVYRTTASGEEAIIGIFTRGESFAEIAALARGNYPANAMTVSDSLLAAIPISAIVAAIGRDADVALAMLASVSRHVRRLVDEIEQMKGLSGQQRVADFLVRLSPVTSGTSMVRLPYEKAVIARKLGMKAESLSRVFQRLQKHGVIIKNDMAVIDDIARLRSVLEGGEPSRYPSRR